MKKSYQISELRHRLLSYLLFFLFLFLFSPFFPLSLGQTESQPRTSVLEMYGPVSLPVTQSKKNKPSGTTHSLTNRSLSNVELRFRNTWLTGWQSGTNYG